VSPWVTAFPSDAFEALREEDDAAADQAHDASVERKIMSICHLGGKLYSQYDAGDDELIGVYSHPGVKCDPKMIDTNDTLAGAVAPQITTRIDNATYVAPRQAVFGTQEGSCCNGNNDASVKLFGVDDNLCCDLGRAVQVVPKRGLDRVNVDLKPTLKVSRRSA
jgi:hypothetical protein